MVITNVNQVVYQGDGVTTAFTFTFRIIDATDIKLLLLDSDGTETDIASDYFVDTVNNTVHYPGYAPGAEPALSDRPPVLAEGQKLVIYRKLPITQEKDLGDKWPFYVIELGLDKLTMILQDIWDWLGRCLCVSKGQAYEAGDDFDPTIPLEADKVICGNANGTGFEAREAMMEVNGYWDGEGRQIKGVADPTDNQDAATKNYVDTLTDNKFMKLQPDGTAWEARNLPISNVAGPALVKDAANKDYVDRILAGYSGQGERLAIFDNVAQMQAAELVPSQMAVTLGYWDVNDNGAGVYTIRDAGADTPDGGSIIAITGTSYVAELITDGTVSVKQFGAKGDGTTDDSAALKAACDFGSASGNAIFVPAGLYICTVTLNTTVDMYGVGEASTIRWTTSQTDGLVITDASLHDMGFEMENDFSGDLVHAKSVNPGCFPSNLKLDNLTFTPNNTNYVGTLLKVDIDNTYGGVFNNIKMKRYSMYYPYGTNTEKCEYGFRFGTPSWVTGSLINNIIIDILAKKPLEIACGSNNVSSDITLMNSQIQCRAPSGFKHDYLTRIAYVGRMKIFNAKIWDFSWTHAEHAVIYYSCSDLVTFYSPLYEKYSELGVDPFYVEGGVNVYGNSSKSYNSNFGAFNTFLGLPYSLTISSDVTKLVPIFIPGGTTSNHLAFDIEVWSTYDWSADSNGGDIYLHLKYYAHVFNKNIYYQYNYTTVSSLIYKIKRYREGIVIWVKGGSERLLNFIINSSRGVPRVGTGMTVTDVDNNTETLELLNVADYSPVPISKSPTIVSGYVIDQNTVLS